MNSTWSDEDIISNIKTGGKMLDQVMKYIYFETEYRLSIEKFIVNNSGSIEDAEDIFQEGIKFLILNIRANKFQQQSTLKSYFIAICKNIWLTHLTRRKKFNSIVLNKMNDSEEVNNYDPINLLENRDELNHLLKNIPQKCKQVLALWSLGYRFEEMAAQLGESSNTLRKRKHDCLKKIILSSIK